MGLLVSILVACVCVAELIGFYAHVRRSLLGSDVSDGDLETIVLNYKGQLASKYRRILTTIYEEDRGVETNYSLSTSPGIIFSSNTNLMTSATDDVTTQKGGASPKKEKFGEPPPKNESADVNHKGASSSRPFPTSEPSEEEPASGPMGMNVEDDPPPTAKLGKITTFTIDYDGITSPSPSKLRLGDGGGLAPPTTSFPAENDRTFAPVLLQSEAALWDSLGGAGENFTPALRRRRRSRSFSPESDALQVGGDALRKVASATQLVPEDYWRRSPSPFRRVLTGEDVESAGEDVIEQFRLVGVVLDDGFKDSLDGVNEERKREFRKKRKANRVTEVAESFVVSGASEGEAVAPPRSPSAKCEASTSGGGGEKPEPFWLIFSGEYTKAMNKDWHGQHFCCWQCDESLTGQRYVLRDDHPYCVACYESVFANGCEKCNKIIGIDSKDLSYKDKHWHEACFLCTICGESLVDKQFGSKADRIYCGRCYDEKFASRCDGCGEIFRAGTKKMEYKTRQWHEKCFCCVVCKTPIGTQSFIPREQEIYCAKCYEEKYATRCIKCNKVITSGGVTYKNEPWHRECFTCTHCQTSLAGARFTSRDDKPYCAECFGELFAKRCFACSKPITGIGGTKFISFEDRHWHNDCFFCASCRTSLVGRGFITDQEDIICPECAKQKLI